jgi:hypothetical protein
LVDEDVGLTTSAWSAVTPHTVLIAEGPRQSSEPFRPGALRPRRSPSGECDASA